MNPNSAIVHMKRAWSLMEGVQKSTEGLRERATEQQNWDGSGSFLKHLAESARVEGQKSSLLSDLQLASQELEAAEKVDSKATLQLEIDGSPLAFSVPGMRSLILMTNGEIEMASGATKKAEALYSQSIEISDNPGTRFLLGVCIASQYRPKEALVHFERSLELDADGEFSVAALREANTMKNWKKGFRGDWGTFCFLLLIWPAAIWYFWKNWK